MSAWTAALLQPHNRVLLALLCLLQLLLIGLPLLWGVEYAIAATGATLVLAALLFSVQRTLLILLFLNIVLPAEVLKRLILPGGLRFEETLFLVALFFALIDLFYRRGFRWTRSPADAPLLVFLAATAFSTLVGLVHDHSTSLILRNVRFPFYYAVFFLATNSIDRRAALRLFVPVLLLAGLIVSFEYILEFAGAIDLSAGDRFVRVARLQGIALPMTLLFLVNLLIHLPHLDRGYRLLLLLALLPVGLAFVLTVGRAMWGAFGVGLAATVWLRYGIQAGEGRNLWRAALLIGALLASLAATVLVFQRFTGSAISAHALERSKSYIDFDSDLHLMGRLASYAIALEAIARHPVLGNGQGASLDVPLFDEETMSYQMWSAWDLDSLYLTLWLKMGLIGLVAFAWMALRILRLAHHIFRANRDGPQRAFAAGAVAVILSMGTLGIADGAMVNGRFTLVFGVLFGLVAVLAKIEESNDNSLY